MNSDEQDGWSSKINKRPNKRRSIHPNEHTGISKLTTQTTPANQLKNPTWTLEHCRYR